MNQKSLLGQILLWLGFFSGAFASVYRFKNGESLWNTIPWGWFIASLVVGAIGIVLIRLAKAEQAGQSEKTIAEFAELPAALQRLANSVREIRKSVETAAPSEISRMIDDQCTEDFGKFEDARESMVVERGLDFYANTMTHFAAAERAVNRAWSASADGYLDEAETCLERAELCLENALEWIQAK